MQTTFFALTGRKSITANNRYVKNTRVRVTKGTNVIQDVKVTGLLANANDVLRGQLADTFGVIIKDIYWRGTDGKKMTNNKTSLGQNAKADLSGVDKALNGVPLDLVIIAGNGGDIRLNFHLIDR